MCKSGVNLSINQIRRNYGKSVVHQGNFRAKVNLSDTIFYSSFPPRIIPRVIISGRQFPRAIISANPYICPKLVGWLLIDVIQCPST